MRSLIFFAPILLIGCTTMMTEEERAEYDALRSEYARIQARLAETEQELEVLRDQAADLDRQLAQSGEESVKQDLDQTNTKIVELEDKADTLRSLTSSLRDQLNDLLRQSGERATEAGGKMAVGLAEILIGFLGLGVGPPILKKAGEGLLVALRSRKGVGHGGA